MYYDSTHKAFVAFNPVSDVALQIGEEMYIRVFNNTGDTLGNSKICYLSGMQDDVPQASLASASNAATSISTLGVATHDIPDQTYGYITAFGTVRGINTAGCTPAEALYLSTTAGEYTNVPPESPNYLIRIGNCGKSDASDGTIIVHVSIGDNRRSTINSLNGLILEPHTTAVSSDGVNVSISLEKTGGGDLSLYFSGAFYVFDSTPAASVQLTAGSDVAPTLNYVYIPESTKVMTASTSGFPSSGAYVAVATVLVQSASSVQTDGVYKWHAWTDHIYDSEGRGHSSHVNEWIRNQHATWVSGSQLTPTGGAGTFDVAVGTGVMYQLHKHSTDSFDTSLGDNLYVINDNTTPYKKVGDLTGELTDSEGNSMSGKSFSLVFWVSGSEGTDDDKLFCNLPSGSYNNSRGAINDISNYTDYTIPTDFKGVGILLARVTVSHASGGGGSWTIEETKDLRGTIPGISALGGGSSAGAEFSDNLFKVFNVTDATKEMALDVSNVTTGTTRTLVVPDANTNIVGHNTTDVLTNKSINLDNNTVTNLLTSEPFKLTDKDTDATASTSVRKWGFYLPYSMTLTEIYASAMTGPTGDDMVIDVRYNGITVFTSTKCIIADGANAGSQTGLATTSLAKGSYLEFYIEQVGTTQAGKEVTAWVLGKRS